MDGVLEELQERLQHRFGEPSLLERALRHSSAATPEAPSNERLEFLGDAVVGLAVSEHLFRTLPESSEGDMTVIKSGVVSRKFLSVAARGLELSRYLAVDEGLRQRGDFSDSMLADAFEAVVGAIFVDGGMEAARGFVLRTLRPRVEQMQANRHVLGYKSLLQQKTQAEGKGVPRYVILQVRGPDHLRQFQAGVHVQGEECGTGWGPTKKDAERDAARAALDSFYEGWQEDEQDT